MYTTYTDNQLLSLWIKGEEEAFSEIYNRYWDKLLKIAYNHTHDQSTAEDIVQNLFVGLWRRKKTLKIDNLEHYLAKAIKFAVFKEYYRKQKRETKKIDQLSVQEEEYIDEQINAKFLEEYIYGIVEKLPKKCRLVFKLSRMRHLNNREISDKMHIATKTVETHMTKALKIIRKELAEPDLWLLFIVLSYTFLV